MKSITWHERHEYKEDLGELIKEIDLDPEWEQDASRLYKKGKKYTLISSSGCSCWDGDWDGWTDLTLAEVKKLGDSWSKDLGGSSKEMGEWIKGGMK